MYIELYRHFLRKAMQECYICTFTDPSDSILWYIEKDKESVGEWKRTTGHLKMSKCHIICNRWEFTSGSKMTYLEIAFPQKLTDQMSLKTTNEIPEKYTQINWMSE